MHGEFHADGRCRVTVEGRLPRGTGLAKADVRRAAAFFAARSSARCGLPFREVAVVLQDDAFSAETHLAINGVEGPTDVTTQGYDALPGEPTGVYGELYVNAERGKTAAPKRKGWSVAKEILLYVAHGMDHLSGADDGGERDYWRMRRRELKWVREFCAQ